MTWLLCDYGEVLSLPPPDDEWTALQVAAGWPGTTQEFQTAYWAGRRAYDRGDVTASEFWEGCLGRRPATQELRELIVHDIGIWLHPNPATVAAAERAGGRGLSLALFSNAPVEVASAVGRAPWLAAFGPKFFSCYLRAAKPEPAAYRAVLAELDAPPEDIVFFDDRPVNVDAAKEAGIDARLFVDPAQIDQVP